MKTFFFLCLLGLTARLFSLPVGNSDNPALAQKGIFSSENTAVNFRLGYEASLGFDRRLKQQVGFDVDEFKVMTNEGSFTLNICKRLDLFSTLGAFHSTSSWRVSSATTLNLIKTETGENFVCSVGANAILFEWGNAALGAGGRYLWNHSPLTKLQINGVDENISDAKLTYNEWQANLGISYKLGFLVPYIGGQFSSARCCVSSPFVTGIAPDGGNTNHLQSRQIPGLYLGCSILLGKQAFINAEARLFDEEAVTLSADLRF
jgi:hypothetical protein